MILRIYTIIHVIIPTLKALAPTQKEPPFAISQFVFLILFIVLGVVAVNKFHV